MEFPTRLLAWYDRHRRDLPWRATHDPWAVWVSEVMLQQTRAEVAGPYFERFLARFPEPAALASAPLDDALALWSGLGYYRRVRQLHAAAGLVSARGGRIPATADELRSLPGIGPYTAAAIASIAFGEPVAVLDGNVTRVMARRLAERGDPTRAAVRRRLLEAAQELLDPARPGDTNQALMELGATVCTPRAPACGGCPLHPGCAAAADGTPHEFPRPRPRRPPRRVRQVAALVEARSGSVLLVRRSAGEALMAGLWEPPTVEASGRGAAERALGERFGGRWKLGRPLVRVRHSVTTRAIELELRPALWDGAEEIAEHSAAAFFSPEDAAGLALTGAARRLLERVPRAGPDRAGRGPGPPRRAE